jgi:hypothetical protein
MLLQQTVHPWNVASFPTRGAFGWRSSAGVRAISHLTGATDPMENLPINTFIDKQDQRNADRARSQGHVVIKTQGTMGRNEKPYVQLSVIPNKAEFYLRAILLT